MTPPKGSVIRLLELMDRGLTLDVPTKTCAEGHTLALDIKLYESDEVEVHFQCTVRVDEVTREDAGRDKIKTSLAQVDEIAWAKIGKVYAKRQEDIFKFFAAAKGN